MGVLRTRLLTRLRDHGPASVDALAGALTLHWADVYHELWLMARDRLVEQTDPEAHVYAITGRGRRAIEVLDEAQAGTSRWRQSDLW